MALLCFWFSVGVLFCCGVVTVLVVLVLVLSIEPRAFVWSHFPGHFFLFFGDSMLLSHQVAPGRTVIHLPQSPRPLG